MSNPTALRPQTLDFIEKTGRERFWDLLVLSFFDSFPGVLGGRVFPVPLYCFYREDTGQQIQVFSCEGKGITAGGETYGVGAADLLVGSALLDIPVLLYSEFRRDHGDMAEDFLKTLFGVAPAPSFPKISEASAPEFQPLPPLLLDLYSLTPVETTILGKLEKGETPFGVRFPAIVIVDLGWSGEKAEGLSTRKNFFTLSLPSSHAGDLLAFKSLAGEGNGFGDLLDTMKERTAHYLDVDRKAFPNIEEEWPQILAGIRDYVKKSPLRLDAAREWFDFVLMLFSGDYRRAFYQEARTLAEWMEHFGMEGSFSFSEMEKNIHLAPLLELVNSFEAPLAPEDGGRIWKLASFFSLLDRARRAFHSSNPAESFLENPGFVTVRDYFAPFFILLGERSQAPGEDLAGILNQATEDYYRLMKSMSSFLGLDGDNLAGNPEASMRHRAFHLALKENLGTEGGVDSMLKTLLRFNRELLQLFHPEPSLMNLLLLLTAADLFTLAGFLKHYRKELNLIIKCFERENHVQDVVAALYRFFQEKRRSDSLVMPTLFLQRIPRILGFN